MARIPIIDKQKKPSVPTSSELSTKIPRCRNTGKPPLQLDKSFSPQGKMK